MPKFKFIHLNCHSSFSLLEGVPSVKALAGKAKSMGMPALGVTDTNNLFGAVEMTKFVMGEGVQPITGTQIGIKISPAEGEAEKEFPDVGLLSLLVKNEIGWRNVTKLSSKALLESPEESDPYIDINTLLEYSEGLILMTGSAREGLLGKYILQERSEEAEQVLLKLSKIFKDKIYIEIQRHGMSEEAICEPILLDFAYKHNLPLVATNDCRYLEKEESFAFEVMLSIGESKTISNSTRRKFTDQHYFKSADEMCDLFRDLPEATANTINIAKRCGYKIPLGINYMPVWLKADGDDREVDDIFRQESIDGLKERMEKYVFTDDMTDEEKLVIQKEYDERLEFEMKIILGMGYPGYFLITSDFIKWAKENDIPVGPGRGSGAGSLVAWAMKVTDINPIPYGLYFERFLNPERVSLPDFDVDFCQDRRDEVIDYVRRKYGDDAVSQIITFGTLKAKACIRDVGRVLDMSFNQVSQIAAFIPEGPASIPIPQALTEDERLRVRYEEEDDVRTLLDICMQLEGAYRHASTHAAGVIIADRAIDEICPLYRDPRSTMPATQFAMSDAEGCGLVKFDFLGLKTLTTIKYCMKMLAERGIEFDISQIPMDDKKTFEMLREGHTIGVFQVESKGMTDFLKKMEPDKFQYLSDVIALYRPGPLGSGMADDFIECRHGRQEPKYPHPSLQPVLEETFGVPVYQEQVMRMAQVLAGYTLGGADMLRRAMGKKKPSEMAKQRTIFVEGAKKVHDVPEAQANEIFDLMEKFSAYGFNKAHTVAYGVVSYQTAYLKANYPLELIAASMTLDSGNDEKILKFKRELERMKVPLFLPDINKSCNWFRVQENLENKGEKGIRFALTALKGAGNEAMKALEKERDENGDYKDIYDFMERQDPKHMNKRQLEALAKAGAFDCFDENRAFFINNVDVLLGYMQVFNKEKNSNQIGLFGGGDNEKSGLEKPVLKPCALWDSFEKLENEQQVIGFYLSSHPLTIYADELHKISRLKNVIQLHNLALGGVKSAKIACIINAKRELKTKKGDRMAILTVSDSSGQDEVALFPESYDKNYDLLEKNKPLIMQLQLGADEERVRINAESITDLETVISKEEKVSICLKELSVTENLKEMLPLDKQGKTKCELSYEVDGLGKVVIRLPKPLDFSRRHILKLDTIPELEVTHNLNG